MNKSNKNFYMLFISAIICLPIMGLVLSITLDFPLFILVLTLLIAISIFFLTKSLKTYIKAITNEEKSAYEREKAKYRTYLELASDAIYLMDTDGNLVDYSNKTAELLGYTPEEMKTLTIYDWDKNVTEELWRESLRNIREHQVSFDRIHSKKDGSTFPCHITTNFLVFDGKEYIHSTVRDTTDTIALMEELRANQVRWQFAVEGNKDGLWDWNYIKNQIYLSPQCKKMLGYEDHEIENTTEAFRDLIFEDDLPELDQSIRDYFTGKTSAFISEHRKHCKDGSYIWTRDRGMVIERTDEGHPKRVIGTITNITEYKEAMETIQRQSFTDELTQIGNRKAYNKEMEDCLKAYVKDNRALTLMIFDIDDFKSVNDLFGHQKGDEVLQKIGKHLMAITKETVFVFRIGGEEFAIITLDLTLRQAKILADSLRTSIESDQTFFPNSKQEVTVSVGLSQAMDGDSEDSLFLRADRGLYTAKLAGKNKVFTC